MKRYFVAASKASPQICIRDVAEIAALLNANKIQEHYVAREWTGPSSQQMMANDDTPWLTIAQLLAEAYKDKPIVTVVLKDIENNIFLMSERYHSEDGPWQVAFGAMDIYFNKHFKEFDRAPPKEFLVYFKSDKCPPSVMTVKLKVGKYTVYRSVIGYKGDPAEETYPYTYDESEPRKVEPPDVFPSVALELKPPKYDPTAPLPGGWD
jgi:hypothetical protein